MPNRPRPRPSDCGACWPSANHCTKAWLDGFVDGLAWSALAPEGQLQASWHVLSCLNMHTEGSAAHLPEQGALEARAGVLHEAVDGFVGHIHEGVALLQGGRHKLAADGGVLGDPLAVL